LQNGIRKTGDRNHGLLTLARYWRATGLPEEEASGSAWPSPGASRDADDLHLTEPQILANVRSVIRAHTAEVIRSLRVREGLGTRHGRWPVMGRPALRRAHDPHR